MPIHKTPDGRYTFAIETPGEGDGNSVVLDGETVVWDRFGYESAQPPNIGPYGHRPPDVTGGPIVTIPQGPTGIAGRTIKVTDASDGELVNRGYSYWSQAVIIGDAVYCFAGHRGGHPQFFRVDLETGSVYRLGALLPYTGEAEGWSWDADGWIALTDGPRLRHVNPFSGQHDVVFDISDTHPDCDLWQSHSSLDGRTHSATVRRIVPDGPYPKIGTVVFREGQQQFFPAIGDLDESILSGDGRYLLIQESGDNRIIDIATRQERILRDGERAVAHCDCGPDYVIGEADKPDPGACVKIDFRTLEVTVLFQTIGMGHVSVRAGRCLLSDAHNLSLVNMDGSGVQTIAQHGMTGDDYDHQVMANLSPCGRVAAYLSNAAGRMDLYLVVLKAGDAA